MSRPAGRSGLSLKARAIALLAQRDQSVAEMRHKLLRIARQVDGSPASDDATDTPVDPSEDVERLLAWLQDQGFLSEPRFVESRIQARAQRWGNARIRQELAQHGLSLDETASAALRDTELQRAADVRRRKFGDPLPSEPTERARQMRFLAARGFSSETIRRVLRADGD